MEGRVARLLAGGRRRALEDDEAGEGPSGVPPAAAGPSEGGSQASLETPLLGGKLGVDLDNACSLACSCLH